MTSPAATILIVDDEIQNRKLLEVLLRPEGYLTLSAANGEEALAAIAERAPDLILLDVMMPGMDGYQVASLLKANPDTASIPIIMVTAQTGRSARLAGLDAGAEEFLTKPVDRAELWLRVRNLLRLKEFSDFLQNHSVILERQVQSRTADLRASELRFRQMAENIRDVFFLVDADSNRMLYISPAYEEIWGRSCESVYAYPESWTEAIHPDDRASTYEKYKIGMSAGTFEYEYRIVRPDGSIRSIEVRGFPVRDDGGTIVRIAGVAEDITERKRTEAQRERWAALVEASPDFIGFADPKTAQLKYVNSHGRKMCGIGEDEDLGQLKISDVHPAWMNERLAEVILPAAVRDGLWEGEGAFLHRDGHEIPVLMALLARKTAAGEVDIFYTVSRDISERKKTENRIKRLNRVYAVLSRINALIVRVRDRDELFRDACRIAVEEGGFSMSMIAIVDRSTMKIVPVASEGVDEELLTAVNAHLSSSGGALEGETTFARVIREKKSAVSNVSPDNPTIMFGKKLAGSTAVLPLIVSDEAEGILALYASESEFFHKEEMKLVTELAGDIAFAMDHIAKAEKLNYIAYYDVLTGLANRSLFLERLPPYKRIAISGGHKLALVLIDLERFKNINDSLGRPAGDALLRQVAKWLTRDAGDANFVARVGADQFAVVLPEVMHEADVARRLEKMMEAFLEHPFRLNDAVFRIGAKVGIALFPDDGANADTLFKNAEAALKKAKTSGDRYLFYTQKMTEAVVGKLTLENQLRQALDKGEFVLHYQPKVSLLSGKLTGAEALIRWNDPRTGLVPPGRFIPTLEETGLINEVGRWALRQAIEDYLRWRAAGLAAVRIAVNVSPLQLRNRGFIAEIEQAIGIDAHAAAGLELEITESLIMEAVKHNIASLQAIQGMGISIAIDDFGTGFSSLSYLAKLPVDTLKIDRSFVIDMTAGPEGLALVQTIVNLAHSLKLKVVAEGVETEEQSHLLRLLSCDEMQGFLFSKPVPGEIFETRFLAPLAAG